MSRFSPARLIWLVLTVVLVWLTISRWNELNRWPFLFWLAAPDILGLLPAMFLGRPPARGALPPRGVWLYNFWHTFWTPLVVGAAVWLVTQTLPVELLLGWLVHIAADRVVGYALRQRDGTIGPVLLWA